MRIVFFAVFDSAHIIQRHFVIKGTLYILLVQSNRGISPNLAMKFQTENSNSHAAAV